MNLRLTYYIPALIFLFLSEISAGVHSVDKQHTKIHDLCLQLTDKLDVNPQAVKNQNHYVNDRLQKQSKKLIAYIPKRVDEIYAIELGSLGSGHAQIMGNTHALVGDSIIEELTFLQALRFTNDLVQNWLGDGKEALWPHIQTLKTPGEILKKIEEKICNWENIQDTDLHMVDSDSYALSPGYTLARTKALFSLKPQRKKYMFSRAFIKQIRVLDLLINRALFDALALCEDCQVGLRAMLVGQASWLTLRGELMDLYECVGVSQEIAALRLVCLCLDRLYYYRKFVKYFREKDSYHRCLQPPPYLYATMLDCDAVVRCQNILSKKAKSKAK
ncbi:MAG: hypothetical protein H6849_01995 [Alphaproteobacteria bacterium]|nr:MAG: hypothetical protein H6849_01995 [Alphaproteobacteria bacterium]